MGKSQINREIEFETEIWLTFFVSSSLSRALEAFLGAKDVVTGDAAAVARLSAWLSIQNVSDNFNHLNFTRFVGYGDGDDDDDDV